MAIFLGCHLCVGVLLLSGDGLTLVEDVLPLVEDLLLPVFRERILSFLIVMSTAL